MSNSVDPNIAIQFDPVRTSAAGLLAIELERDRAPVKFTSGSGNHAVAPVFSASSAGKRDKGAKDPRQDQSKAHFEGQAPTYSRTSSGQPSRGVGRKLDLYG